MRGCLSEFLNLLEIRGQNWCLVDLGEENGIRSPSGDAVYFYAVLEGAAKLSGVRGSPLSLGIGDVVMVMPGQAHAIRTQAEAHAETIGFLAEGQYADFPPSFAVGEGAWAARLLCGRLTVRWPGGLNPAMLPASLSVSSDRTMVNMEALLGGVQESGGAAVLTRAAALLLTSALRAHPDCQMLFHDAQSHDPIGRAIHYMEVHPFQDWTVAGLAQKVGMG
ncbi:MAG: cupin domain-containing protein, partial [Sphingobium sp.]